MKPLRILIDKHEIYIILPVDCKDKVAHLFCGLLFQYTCNFFDSEEKMNE